MRVVKVLLFGLWLGVIFTNCNKSSNTVFYNDSEHIIAKLDKTEKAEYWNNRKKSDEIFRKYKQLMGLVNSEGKVSRKKADEFKNLFTDKAKVWADILKDPYPLEPLDYALLVKKHLRGGVKASVKTFGNYSEGKDKRYLQYYKVGEGEKEYYLHFAVEKKLFAGLNENMEKVEYLNGEKVILLEFVIYINDHINLVKIADIKPLLN